MSVIEIGESQGFPSVLNVKRGPELRRYVPERTCHRVEYKLTGNLICSECGYGIPRALDRYAFVNYCPHCGARIERGDHHDR